jgi:hypothetical protein
MALRLVGVIAAAGAVMIASARPVLAQAWPMPAHTAAIAFVVEEVDHVGRLHDDGTREPVGKFVNLGFDAELDYSLTDRFSVSTSLPYIVSRYTDPNPSPPFIPFAAVDACRCWSGAFADFGVTSRYNLVNRGDVFMFTPFVSVGLPSHAYDYVGEAVPGRRLKEFKIGAAAGQRLDRILNGLSLQAGYQYTMVGRVLDVPNNRSDGSVEAAMAFPRGFSTSAIVNWQRTHGGLRFPVDVRDAGIPARLTEFHRLLRDNYLHVGGSASYARGPWQISAEALVTARGSNAHDVHVLSIAVGRLFEIGRPR